MITNESLPNASPCGDSDIPAALDHSVLGGLRALADGDDEMIAAILSAFVDDGKDRLQKMHDAVAAGDETAARRAAHSLKGMSSSIGANHLSDLSHALEKSAPGTITRARVEVLERAFERVSVALKTA